MTEISATEQQHRDRTLRFVVGVLGAWNMASWLMYASSSWSTGGEPWNLYMLLHFAMLVIVQPLVTLPGLYLAWKNERLNLALLLVAIPWMFFFAGLIVFAIGVAIYGF